MPVVSNSEMAHAGISWADVSVKLSGSTPLQLAQAVPSSLLQYLGTSYDALFQAAFGSASPNVTRERAAMALAAYERTLVPDAAPIDTPLSLNALERQGFLLFTGRATRSQFARTCSACHSANLFGAFDFDGVAFEDENDNLFSDGLRHAIGLAPTGSTLDGVPFKTPTLRNVGLRKRFMHDGRMSSLMEVLDFYNGDTTHGDAKFGFATPLTPSEQLSLEAFLLALTDARIPAGTPPFDRPVLYSEVAPFESNLYGDTTPPQSANAPHILAADPPLVFNGVDNPYFRIGLGNAGSPLAAYVLYSGAPSTGMPFYGVTLYLDPSNVDFGYQQVNSSYADTATAKVRGVLDDISLIGRPFYAQWLLIRPGARVATEAASFLRF